MSSNDRDTSPDAPPPDVDNVPEIDVPEIPVAKNVPETPVVKDVPEIPVEPTVVVTLPRAKSVGVHDTPAIRVRYPADLLGLVGATFGIVVVCLLVVYAGNTTQGITEDVQGAAKWVHRIVTDPVAVFLRTVLVLFVPIAVSVALLLRRLTGILLTSLAAALGGLILDMVALALLDRFATATSLARGLAVGATGGRVEDITLPAYVAAMTALLLAAARPARRRSLTASWTLLWVTVSVDVVLSKVSLGGMGLALLLGVLAGLTARYTVGVPSERAYGPELVEALRKIGFEAASLERASLIQFDSATGGARRGRVQVPQFFADHRLYALKTVTGEYFDLVVLDGDRQVVGVLRRWWRQLRSRGIEARSVTSLRQSAERAALLAYSVRATGVRTPGVRAMVEADDSMLIVREPVPESVPLADLDDADVTDRLVRQMWQEIGRAHRAGTVHRALTDLVFRVQTTDVGATRLWILGWESGDVAGSNLARLIDQAQLLAVTALRIGPERAVAMAAAQLAEEDLRAIGSLLQTPAMAARTREQLRANRTLLAELREGLVARSPAAEVEPVKLARLSARTVVSSLLTAVALFVVLTSFNLEQVGAALQQSRWQWAAACFGFGLVGVLGATLILIAFAPVKLNFFKAYISQLAAGYVAVSVPAGIGTAGLNLRFLTKRGVKASLATATAALIQVSQGTITVLALVALTVTTDSTQSASFRVGPVVLVVAAIAAGCVGVLFAIPKVRTWILGRILPTVQQTWPRLVDLVSSPGRLALGVGGNLLMLGSYALALQSALRAFGRDLGFVPSAIAHLIGSSAGSIVPTPGGLGAIEAAELAALGAAGVNAGVAASVVVLFRLLTFWIRIPLGWVAYRALERRGDL
ncbi:MAG: lysylphosphatidylglycerol synthase domain-containing protein [Propionibacteriaceae bacterium]|jgi:uncharacterized membrane protein YbhN (UPF0104 family)/predicted small secreted protein|nr:lysylphosphatidylglycerol synthase domain-containing protein [Propionibacteriaceae bacterium]